MSGPDVSFRLGFDGSETEGGLPRRICGPTVAAIAVLSCAPLIASMHLIVGAVVLVVVLPVLFDAPPAVPVRSAA